VVVGGKRTGFDSKKEKLGNSSSGGNVMGERSRYGKYVQLCV
jgi:hypothetical protein